ncbi:MAG: glutamate--tRNA ligase [Minisyncoccia bacterium]
MNQDPKTPQSLFGPRVRIAPSPTGWLHIGTARTALFNFLFARQKGGKFILRIEDTDKERSKKEYEENILEGLKWLNLEWDEGPDIGGPYGPYRQSERTEIYKEYLLKLLKEEKIYYCFCKPEEIEAQKRDMALRGLTPIYSGKCRHLSDREIKEKLLNKEKYVLRLKMPSQKIKFKDLIRGEIEFDLSLIGDIVIAKSLEEPLYNFTVVIDDYLMEITHVIRGDDHISNTPKQLVLQEMLQFESPLYAHLPMILGPDRSKLSKRHGEMALTEYKKLGYLKEAMINFLALLGWHPKEEEEIFSLEKLIANFSLERIQKSGAIFNILKLDWFNSVYLKKLPLEELEKRFVEYLKGSSFNHLLEKYDLNYLMSVLKIELPRINKFSDLFSTSPFFFEEELSYPKELLIWKDTSKEHTIKALEDIYEILKEIPAEDFTNLNLQTKIMAFIDSNSFYRNDRGKILWPFRVALSGQKASPSPFEIAEAFKKEKTLKMVEKAINLLKENG